MYIRMYVYMYMHRDKPDGKKKSRYKGEREMGKGGFLLCS